MNKLDVFAIGFGGVMVGVVAGINAVFNLIIMSIVLIVLYLLAVYLWIQNNGR